MAERLRWGILGTGRIAEAFAKGLAASERGALFAVGSRTQENAEAFGAKYGAERRHGSYEALLADPDVEAVYLSTPHPMHAEWAIKTLEAGKHLLCEKPIGMNHAEAMAIVEAARAADRFLMEAFMYRCHPQTAKLTELIRSGAIGEVRVIQASFAYDRPYSETTRTARQYAPELGGGGILDVGCYPASMARLLAGATHGQPFADPEVVTGAAHLGETGVDNWAAATLRFSGGIVAQLLTGVNVNTDNSVRIFGSGGDIHIPWPWKPGTDGNGGDIIVRRVGQEPETIMIDDGRELYSIEADTATRYIREDAKESPMMPWADTLGNMATLDRWREAVGLTYPSEQPAAVTQTVSRRTLARAADANSHMTYGTLAGIEKRVSRLIMGVDNQRTMPHLAVMLDDFYERGGTVFDTAWIYAGGTTEKLLGQWVQNRGVREDVVILTKGLHTPLNRPEYVDAQITESLSRLQMDYVDLYVLHRDNPDVLVGEWMEALHPHVAAGRARLIGASNWSIERVEAANEYARAHGLTPFSVVSNNFSLARMVEPVWKGCISASDAGSRAWLTRTQMPLLPWSSQARGFFTDRAASGKTDDPELVRCWYSDDNWERRRRAVELAARRGVLPINVALAYVLNQPFPTFPLIGPRTLEETRTSLPAVAVALTPGELRWLNLEADTVEG